MLKPQSRKGSGSRQGEQWFHHAGGCDTNWDGESAVRSAAS